MPGSEEGSPVATPVDSLGPSTSEDEPLAGSEVVPDGVTGGTAGLGTTGVTGVGVTEPGVTGFGVTGFEPGGTGFEVVPGELGVTLGTLPVGAVVEQSTEHVASLERDAEHADITPSNNAINDPALNDPALNDPAPSGAAPNHPNPIAMTFFTAVPQ